MPKSVVYTKALKDVYKSLAGTRHRHACLFLYRDSEIKNLFHKKLLETLGETPLVYNLSLSRPRQLALTYCFLLLST
jgi:hypothetical protein